MRCSVAAVLSVLAGCLLSTPGWAVDKVNSDDESGEPELEEITIVGSRVIRSNLDSPSPVITFDAVQLQNLGITTLGEFSRFLPQNAGLEPPGLTGGGPTAGTSGFNLRGIGMDGTLTLVNGRRIAPYGSSGDIEPFVDINAIPVAAIERIEILTDGASAIYGSEAVAGVVNIVTYKSFDGLTAEGGFLSAYEGDGEERDLSITGGWRNERTSVTGTLSWFDGNPVWNRDRGWASTTDLREQGGYDYGNSASSPPTVLLLDSDIWLADPACPDYSDTAHKVVWVPGKDEGCMFNFRHFTTLQQPSKRLGLTASIQHDLTDTTRFFAELLASDNETRSTVAPTVLLDFFVPADHPGNPFGEDLILEGRTLDTGPREFRTEATSWRLVTGFKGTWSTWNWEVGGMAAESQTDQTRFNAILGDPLQAALLGMGGPNGDQYYNPFGLNPQNPAEVIDQFLINGTHYVETGREQTLDFQVTGKFCELPGGPVGAAFGGQFRHDSVSQSADVEELTGVITGGPAGLEPISASHDVYSLFAEFVAPLLPALEAQLALRLDDYSDFGSTVNPKIGLGWRPAEQILLRATWGTSFRPPTFRELYDPLISFDDVVNNDPWRCPVTGLRVDCRFNLITSQFSGNPDLKPDKGKTWLLGIAWEPEAFPGFSIEVDYWSIEHRDRITTSEGRFLFENLPPDQNPYVIRAPATAEDVAMGIPGVIIGRSNSYINADTVTTDGVDLNLNYGWDTASAGHFSGGVTYTYLANYKTGISFHGATLEENVAGRFGDVGALPRNRGSLHLDWERNGHGVSALLNYAGRYQSPVNWVVDGEETDRPFVVSDYWQLDLQYSYTFERLKAATLRVGCRNCFDANPPVYNYPVPGEPFHEARGGLFYVRWTQPFK